MSFARHTHGLCTRRSVSLASCVLALTLWTAPDASARQEGPAPALGSEVRQAIELADSLSLAFEHATSAVAKSVVTVRSAVRVRSDRRADPFEGFGGSPFEGSPFEDFFGEDFFERFAPRGGEGFVRRGQGSGFVVSADGLVLTNNHVVDGASEVRVQLADGRTREAEVVGTDPSTDLALLRVEADGLTPVRFGDSDALRVGSWVVAVGNPLGLTSTMTAGVVSATGRTGVGIADYEDFIQTDAAINPGNSGGPLVNLRGEVVGVNTAIATRTGGNMGIGFAIPSNMAVSVFEQLRDEGVVTRGWLGVVIQDLTPGLAESFGFEGLDGALVSQVNSGGPAEKAGLREGDIIVAFDGQPVASVDGLRLRVAAVRPGSEVRVTVVREGERRDLRVRVGRLDERGRAAAPAGESDTADRLGLGLRPLDPELADRLGLEGERGVLVTSVEPMSPAAAAGLRPRDLITHVENKPVDTPERFAELVGRAERGVRLTVRTGSAQRFVFLRLED